MFLSYLDRLSTIVIFIVERVSVVIYGTLWLRIFVCTSLQQSSTERLKWVNIDIGDDIFCASGRTWRRCNLQCFTRSLAPRFISHSRTTGSWLNLGVLFSFCFFLLLKIIHIFMTHASPAVTTLLGSGWLPLVFPISLHHLHHLASELAVEYEAIQEWIQKRIQLSQQFRPTENRACS